MIYTIIQARMGSSRLPEKVLKPIGHIPVIQHVYNRISKCKMIDKVLVATSTNNVDDVLCDYCNAHNIPCFRGSENDVLDRYYQAAKFINSKPGDYIVRITGDCPFIDWKICDDTISLVISQDYDYTNNTITESFPDGFDCEVMKFSILEEMFEKASGNIEREHVTQYILRRKNEFRIGELKNNKGYSDLRLTLDTEEDYNMLEQLYTGINKEYFTFDDIIEYIKKNPELTSINAMYERNEGLKNSKD